MPWASARLLPLMLNGAPLPSPQSKASPCFARSSAHNRNGISASNAAQCFAAPGDGIGEELSPMPPSSWRRTGEERASTSG